MLKTALSIVLIALSFLLGVSRGAPGIHNKPAVVVAPVVVQGGNWDFYKECDNTVWNFYCAGQPGCDCKSTEFSNTGCGDSASGSCCKTCFR